MTRDTRAVSDVLGYILMFSLVLASIAMVSTVGLSQIEDVRNVEQMNNAESAFDLLATNLDDIARRGAPSRSTEMQLSRGQLELTDTIQVRFKGINQSGGVPFNESYDVRPIRYRGTSDDRAVLYSGGAVFRMHAGSGTTVRAPSIVAANDRVAIPLVQTRAPGLSSRGGGTARLRATHSQTQILETDVDGTYQRVFMNVTSPRAPRWVDTIGAYDGFTCSLNESVTPARAECHATNPDVLQISLVQIDVTIDN